MKRNISLLSKKEFDVVVIGGGIFGAAVARDAVLRGMTVALIEKEDFCCATSANHLKMVHGGIRYLQHGDIKRLRQSMKERRAFLRTAPHLVRPLPVVMPSYGHGLKGKELLSIGFGLYDMLTLDRNSGIEDDERKIQRGKLLSKKEILELFPGLKKEGLTGGAVFYDGQMYSPPRLTLSFILSAAEEGAQIANYVEALDFLRSGRNVCGVSAIDLISQQNIEIKGKIVVNAAGPWVENLLGKELGITLKPKPTFSRDACFVIPRKLSEHYGLAVITRSQDPDALLSREGRHLFIAPWRDHTLVGVWHVVHKGKPGDFRVTQEDLTRFTQEVNAAYPGANLKTDEVSLWNAGLILFGENEDGTENLSFGKASRIVDHAADHGVEGLISLIGVRFTTARLEAENTVDLIGKKLGRSLPHSVTSTRAVYGGGVNCFSEYFKKNINKLPPGIGEASMSALLQNHGAEHKKVLDLCDGEPLLKKSVGSSHVLRAEVVQAVRNEMALKLADVILRRTDLGTAGYPGSAAIACCMDIMAKELKWDESRKEDEFSEIRNYFSLRCLAKREKIALDNLHDPK